MIEEDAERFVMDVADMTDEEITKTAGELDDRFQTQRRRHQIRPMTEVGPDGLTDQQIAEMAQAMDDALWDDHLRQRRDETGSSCP